MKVDLAKFDTKQRFYQFYLCIERWTFMFAVTVANWDFQIHVGKMDSIEKVLLEA